MPLAGPIGGWRRCAARRRPRSREPERRGERAGGGSSEIVKYVNYVASRKEEGALDRKQLLEVFRTALTARRFEERVTRMARGGEIPATLHVGAGHEVCQAAALAALRPDDPLLYGHRGTAYWIARGLDLGVILCDIAGLEGGTNNGRGGVMHVVDPTRAVLGESGTLGGNFVIGAGVAYAERALGRDTVTIVFFGDGTSNRGQFHEAANFAAVDRLPLILLCENNGWGLSVPTSRSTSVPDIASRAAGYGMPGVVVDGSDASEVFDAVTTAATRARAGEGPTLLEAKVNRIAGHWLGDREPYRSSAEREALEAADPLPALESQLRKSRALTAKKLEALEAEIATAIDDAVAYMRRHVPASLEAGPEGGRRPAVGRVPLGAAESEAEPPTSAEPRRARGRAPERPSGPASNIREAKYAHAIREALAAALRDDQRVVVFGEDVGPMGGVWGVLRGLHEEFGDRVFDTPISENLIVGMAVGMALQGLRPVAELQYADFVFCAGDEVFLKAATWRYAHGGDGDLPMVVRMASGGSGFGPEHSQCTEAYLMHTPGLVVAVPSTPADAKGLMTAAIRSPDPVFFFEHKFLYGTTGPVPEGDHEIPFGQAAVRRPGTDLTIVAWQDMLRRAEAAAEKLSADGIEVEILDPRTLNPFDIDALVTSVQKTGGCVVVEEAPRTLGVGAEIGALLMEHAFGYLEKPLARLAIPDVPTPTSPHLVDQLVPSAEDIVQTVRDLLT